MVRVFDKVKRKKSIKLYQHIRVTLPVAKKTKCLRQVYEQFNGRHGSLVTHKHTSCAHAELLKKKFICDILF